MELLHAILLVITCIVVCQPTCSSEEVPDFAKQAVVILVREKTGYAFEKIDNMFNSNFAYCTNYTCCLWADYPRTSYSALRVHYNNAFRVLMGLPRYWSASGMFAEARVDCFYATMRKRYASLVRRVRGSSNSILSMIASRLDCSYINYCNMISAGVVRAK